MSHGHAGHRHVAGPDADRGRLIFGLVLLGIFMAAEVAAGVVAHSLALLSDAGHMLTDAGALALSLVVIGLAARPPKGGLTYGLKRTEILSGLANGVTLLVIAALIVYEALRRLISPPDVDARLVLGVTAYLSPIHLGERMHVVDLIGLVVITLLGVLTLRGSRKITRLEGAILVLAYVAFIVCAILL